MRVVALSVATTTLVWCGWCATGQPDPKMCMGGEATVPFGKAVREAFFQFQSGLLNFNHGARGATPRPVRHAMEAFTDEMEAAPTVFFNTGYHDIIDQVRPRLAELLHANASDLTFLDDASAGLNAMLRSINWEEGDIMLLTSAAYPLLPNLAEWLEERYRIRVVVAEVEVPFAGPEAFVSSVQRALEEAAEEGARVRLAVFDHISSCPPVILPIRELTRQVKALTAGEALVLIDGAHAVGHVPVNLTDLAEMGVDCYVGDGHKWLMAPKGSGVLWATPYVQSFLQPAIISSHNVVGTKFPVNFEYIGTRDYTPWCAMGAAMDFRNAQLGGEDCVQRYCVALGRWAAAMLSERFGTEAVAPPAMIPALTAVRLPIPFGWSEAAQAQCAGIVADGLMNNPEKPMHLVSFNVTRREGGPSSFSHWIRVSAQVYLDAADFYALADRVESLIRSCTGGVAGTAEAGYVL